MYEGGGGYFEGGEGIDLNGIDRQATCFGGIYNQGSDKSLSHKSGSGGTAGSGGTVNVASTATVYAYNGNLYTDGTNYLDGLNQCPIYLQNGIVVAKYKYLSGVSGGGRWKFTLSLVSSQSTASTSGYANSAYNSISDDYRYITKNSVLSNVDMSTQGVGSGAGYIEVSNGTYTIDSSMDTAVQSDT